MTCIPLFKARFLNLNEGRVDLGLAAEVRIQ